MKNWHIKDNHLVRTFEFQNFKIAFSFMMRVAFEAEKHEHHPTWENTYNKVYIKLTTHDAGNKITEKDKNLAGIIDKIYSDYS